MDTIRDAYNMERSKESSRKLLKTLVSNILQGIGAI